MMILRSLNLALLLMAAVATSVRAQGQSDCMDLSNLGVDTVVTPASDNYDEARSQFASELGSFDNSDAIIAPDAIVYAQSEGDLQQVLQFVSVCKQYKIAIRSGGHQYAGYSSCQAGQSNRCIQVDMSSFSAMSVEDDNFVTVGVGANLGELNSFIQQYGLAIPFGICQDVGVGGHYQTSSVGILTRQFGLGMDHVKSFRIMTADGTVQAITKESDSALYDGVLGGAPGSFGIVLDYTFEALKDEDYPNSHTLAWAWVYSNDLFRNLMEGPFTQAINDPDANQDLTLYMVVTNPSFLRAQGDIDTHLIILSATWVGIESGEPLLGANYEGGPDSNYDKYIKPFSDIKEPFQVFIDTPAPLSFVLTPFLLPFNVEKFRFFEKTITSTNFAEADYYEVVANQIDAWIAIPSVYVILDFQPWGGNGDGTQMNRNKGLNGYPHRDMKMIADNWVFFQDESLADDIQGSIEGFVENVKDTSFYQDRRTWQSTDTISALDADLEKDGPELYYPSEEQYEGLLELKARVDPENIFSSKLSIPLKPQLVNSNGKN